MCPVRFLILRRQGNCPRESAGQFRYPEVLLRDADELPAETSAIVCRVNGPSSRLANLVRSRHGQLAGEVYTFL